MTCVTIPLNIIPDESHAQQAVTVLIVESDINVIKYIDEILSSDYKVLHVNNAEQAQPLLDGKEIAILICGEYLSGENGLVFMARMNHALPHMQPILLSEGISEDLLAFAINDVGVLKYLKKPLSRQALIDAVNGARAHYNKAVANDMLQDNYKAIVEETQSLPYMARRVKEATPVILNNIGTSATAASGTLIFLFLLIMILSITLTIGIYLFKSILGIDVFSGSHFTDLIH